MGHGSYRSTRKGIRVHRRSDLQTCYRCPARHHAEKQLGDGAIYNRQALERGTWFHAGVEAMLKPMRGNNLGMPLGTDALGAIAKCPSSLREEVMDLLRRWIKRFPITHVIDVEVLLSSEVLNAGESPDGLAHHVGGRLDLVTHPQMVWDWKTGWAVPSIAALMQEIQPCSYALMASDKYGWTEVDVAVDFVRLGVTRLLHFDLAAIKAAAIRVKEHILDLLAWEKEVAQANPSEARPGIHCNGCPLITRCDVAHPDAIKGQPDAEQMATALLQEDMKATRRRKNLRDYIASLPNRRMEAGGAVFEIGLEGPITVDDVQALATLLADHGHDPWTLLKVDTEKLRSFVKKNPGLRDDVATLVVDHRTTQLKIRKE